MNQAFGGAFLIKIALIFLSIYIAVLAFAMNYAKVFTMKNRIINIIQQYEGFEVTNSALINDINAQAQRLSYRGTNRGYDTNCINTEQQGLYCIKRFEGANNTAYYRVTTYIQFDIPVVNRIASGVIPVNGETGLIYEFD